MSKFKEELTKTTVSKYSLEDELQRFFRGYPDRIVEEEVHILLKNIKEDILKKSKSGQYKTVDSERVITGHISAGGYIGGKVKIGERKYSYLKGNFGKAFTEIVKQKYFFDYPSIQISGKVDDYCLDIRFSLVNVTKKTTLFTNKPYRIFRLTEAAEELLSKLKEKALLDDIFVDSVYISAGEDKVQIGERYYNPDPSIANLTIKYSIGF
ncbi:MAG: hypothetical protein PUC33_06640 [Oscillospiraceae bacterium]|nr:hypothetical protein [Oscillospiraceae bacterium]